MISVAIVENVESFSKGVQTLLNTSPGFRCVAACASAEEALSQLPALKPDVVLMDIQLPKATGVECVRELKALLPNVNIMMLTSFGDNAHVFNALKAGAKGYLAKPESFAKLLEEIRELHGGGSPMSAAIARMVVTAFGEADALSIRENEVLDRLAKGHRPKEVSEELGISYHTVRTHVQHIYEKLHVCSLADALRKRRKTGS